MIFPSYSASRRLIWALAISVVAHAVLLVQDDFQTPNPRLAQPLMATLRSFGVNTDKVPTTPAPGLPPPAARTRPAVHKPAAVVPSDFGRPQTQEQAPVGASPAVSPKAASAALANESQPGVTVNVFPDEGLDPDGLRAYRVALAAELRRFKSYPPRAVEAGWTGTVEIGISINATGDAQTVLLTKTSGYRELDEKALDMMRHAAPRTAIPGALRGQPFSIKLPIAFTLDEE